MKNISIAQRLALMIGVSLFSLLAVGFVGLHMANKETASIKQLNEDSLASIGVLGEARQAFMLMRVAMYTHVLTTDEEAMKTLEASIETQADTVAKRLKSYENMLSNDEDKKLLEADVSNLRSYLDQITTQALPKSRGGDKEAARSLMVGPIGVFGARTLTGFDAHMAFNVKFADDTVKAAMDSAAQGKMISITVIVLGVLGTGLLGFFLLTSIKTSLSGIRSLVTRVEHDLDFTLRATTTRRDEIGEMSLALNRLFEKLQGNLKSIAVGAQSVASAANQMATTSDQVAAASHQQSEAASGMAATVEQMTVSINHVADRAQEANRLSSESGQLASTGERVIGQTASDIEDIAATVNDAAQLIHGLELHSQQISTVVAVIKEVADQTNLLALNAAIEAARAGEQGRGFAVVADEVRKLAERTASSTQEIARTIDSMRSGAGNAVTSMQAVVSKVTLGVERAREANASIKQIGEGSRNAVGMVEEIAAAIREQGSATNNIATQVERIAQMSEESSAAAGHSAQSARDLDRLAAEMQQIVSAYRL